MIKNKVSFLFGLFWAKMGCPQHLQLGNQSFNIFLHPTASEVHPQHSLDLCLSPVFDGESVPLVLYWLEWKWKADVSSTAVTLWEAGLTSSTRWVFWFRRHNQGTQQNPPAGRGTQQRGGSPWWLRALLWIKQEVDLNWREQFNLLIEGEEAAYLLETIS